MDYQAVYERFISDRRRKERFLTKGFDVHHIQPRSLGGSNEASNLIRLNYADHMFAHIILAKLHPEMEVPAALMLTYRKYCGKRSRSTYSDLRSRAASEQSDRVNRLWSDPQSRLRSADHLKAKSDLAKRMWSDPSSAMRSAERNRKISIAMRGNTNGVKKGQV